MALLNNLFDVLRGWPNAQAIDETFPVHVTAGVPDVLPPGSVVSVQADGTVALATTPNLGAADAIPTWVVVESNQDFSGQFLEKVVCLRKNAEFRLDPSGFIAGAYAVGSLVSFSAGKFKLAASGDQIVGEVTADNRATNGTLNIYYHGGAIKKF